MYVCTNYECNRERTPANGRFDGYISVTFNSDGGVENHHDDNVENCSHCGGAVTWCDACDYDYYCEDHGHGDSYAETHTSEFSKLAWATKPT